MVLYHFHVGQVKRSAGQSVIESAAYRAGERLYSERYGEYSDYIRKGGWYTLRSCCRRTRRASTLTGRHFGTLLRPPSAEKTRSSPTALTSRCKTSSH